MCRSIDTTGAIQVLRPSTVVNAFQTSFGEAATVLSILKTRSPALFVTEVLRTSWLSATTDGQSAPSARRTESKGLLVMLWISYLVHGELGAVYPPHPGPQASLTWWWFWAAKSGQSSAVGVGLLVFRVREAEHVPGILQDDVLKASA